MFDGRPPDLTEENLQARIRGNLLMALSNKFGWLVLTTGNKSEMAVGYSTLYGDSAGGFAVIKDCPKTLVYELARHRNARAAGDRGPIPQSIIDRAPSAELRPDQRDDDSLPPYDVLDPILDGYIEDDLGRDAADPARVRSEHDVERVIALVDRAEYKRRQAPPGIKITDKGVRARPADADHEPLRRLDRPRFALAASRDRDRHPRQHAQPPLVVGDLDLPHPGRPAAMLDARGRVDRPLGDRAQEARLVREAHRRSCRRPPRRRRAERREALGDRRVDAAVDQAGGLLELVADLDLGRRSVVRDAVRSRGRTGRRSPAPCR